MVMLADGLRLLQTLGDLSELSIVSNGKMFSFSMPTKSQPLVGYPTWPTAGHPWWVSSGDRALERVDVVMMAHPGSGLDLVGSDLSDLMAGDFVRMRESEFWALYVRRMPRVPRP